MSVATTPTTSGLTPADEAAFSAYSVPTRPHRAAWPPSAPPWGAGSKRTGPPWVSSGWRTGRPPPTQSVVRNGQRRTCLVGQSDRDAERLRRCHRATRLRPVRRGRWRRGHRYPPSAHDPSIVVAHTVLLEPTDHRRKVFEAIAKAASVVVVMAMTAGGGCAPGSTSTRQK